MKKERDLVSVKTHFLVELHFLAVGPGRPHPPGAVDGLKSKIFNQFWRENFRRELHRIENNFWSLKFQEDKT
jgi:hypothetical protein